MASEPQRVTKLPDLPAHHGDFIQYVNENEHKSISELLQPYKDYDSAMREVFAQHPSHEAISTPSVVSIFSKPGDAECVRIRARDLAAESASDKEQYLIPLAAADRRPNSSPAIVPSVQQFRRNFAVFSESSLSEMDWSNVVCAGSAVVTSLLPVPEKYADSKRSLREYYHERVAPASDVDLFLYGLTEEQAIEKIKQVEKCVRDCILTETTTIRTKNAITIASQHPTRHVQIVLRIYKSISEILTGFDVDCSCAAYNGEDVYASPRALGAYMTQINTIDLTRRSPSYENRLSKYSKRGFEIYWPKLERERIDPTIFERNFGRTSGLARLLVLEKLPSKTQRDDYQDQRRRERGRPRINRLFTSMRGNMKEQYEDEVAEWIEETQESNYHTFTIPYGPKYNAKKIVRLLYAKDLLLNAEWNRPKDRETTLHRHPAFFGHVEDVITDCCGYCPKPLTLEDEEIAAEESKNYVSGTIEFMRDDPGRQAIGSFNPITDDDWTEMAYIGNTEQLCQAIVDLDLEHVRTWLKRGGSDLNRRDHTGRTPLQLAVSTSSEDIVQALIDAGARLIARLADGKTALHLAAMHGKTQMAGMILRRSEQNEEDEENKKEAQKREDRTTPAAITSSGTSSGTLSGAAGPSKGKVMDHASDANDGDEEDEFEDDEDYDENDSDDVGATSSGSYVRVRPKPSAADQPNVPEDDDVNDPDVFDVNVTSWDVPVSPLHLAIANGHLEMVKLLVQEHGADVLLPVKLVNNHDKSARAAILPIVLAMLLPISQAEKMIELLIDLGATVAQADMDQITAFHYAATINKHILQAILRLDAAGCKRALQHLAIKGSSWSPLVQGPLQSTIETEQPECAELLLQQGVGPTVNADAFIQTIKARSWSTGNKECEFETTITQPVILAVEKDMPVLARKLLDAGADPNTLTTGAYDKLATKRTYVSEPVGSLLDRVDEKCKDLQKWYDREAGDDLVKPPPFSPDSSYVTGLKHGSYLYWRTVINVKQGRKQYLQQLKTYNDGLKRQQARKGVCEKRTKVASLLKEFGALRHTLKAHMGAKSISELHASIEPLGEPYGYTWKPAPIRPFAPSTTYSVKGLTESRKTGYDRLFQACWVNDAETVQKLAMTVWNDDQSPLQIAVKDGAQLNPFSIAVLRGHMDLAELILEIAQAQYSKDGDKTGDVKYSLNRGDGDLEYYDSDDEVNDPDHVRLYGRLVSDTFTIDDIGTVQTQVKSQVSPATMLQWPCPVHEYQELNLNGPAPNAALETTWNALAKIGLTSPSSAENANDEDVTKFPHGKPENLLQLCIHNNDEPLLTWLLDLAVKYTKIWAKINQDASSLFVFPEADFARAIALNRTSLLNMIVQRTGAGIPLDALVEKSGVEMQGKPKKYQGLSVYGKKRADWAARAGGDSMFKAKLDAHPPLLEASHHGALESVEYFLSDAATRHYHAFAEKNSHDKRLQTLSESQGGLHSALGGWLSTRSQLAMHCVILGKPSEKAGRLLSYLIDKMPDQLEAKSLQGYTPLLLAFSLHRKDMIEILIQANADQTAREVRGRNILHAAIERLDGKDAKDAGKLRAILELIDPRLLPSLATERSALDPGSLTPLAAWLTLQVVSEPYYDRYYRPGNNKVAVTNDDIQSAMVEYFNTIVSFTKGIELALVNGAGDTPLHGAVRRGFHRLVPAILDVQPDLLHREDATGRTPYDVAEDAHLSILFEAPPAIERLVDPYHYSIRRTTITVKEPETFVEGWDTRTAEARVWDSVRERSTKTAGTKRKLCGLAEANEVAKRLAGRNRRDLEKREERQRIRAEGKVFEEPMDEVTSWYEAAKLL